jgi:N-methylhydantoinase A
MRFAVDTGGTFTDLVIENRHGRRLVSYKTPTTVDRPLNGVLEVLQIAADDLGLGLEDLLGQGETFIHGTTRAINAILTETTAKTAFLTTRGHPDVLLFREGGRTQPFDFTRPYPKPYVPRHLTFEITERVGAEGEIVVPLKEHEVVEVCGSLRTECIEAVGVCFLWSIVNSAHETCVGQLLDEHLPGIPYTLSHRLNPIWREYRRASSTCIDASLKPLMTDYLRGLERSLRERGFQGRVLMVSSTGGLVEADAAAEAPIHTVMSGPAMAPIAGRFYATADAMADTAIVADTGGTSYDVSLVRDGRIPRTQETWLGPRLLGHMTGFPSVDVKSIGAGGGSIAWVDDHGLLHVGPESAGARPGPACYGRGGTRATVTDASLVLGYIDADYFLGGAMQLDVDAARDAVARDVGEKLRLDAPEAAAAILELATEHMVQAIEDITINQGIDPRGGVLVGGGGAAGLNAVAIANRLRCTGVLIPQLGAALSAAGSLMSDLTAEYAETFITTSDDFDSEGANEVLDRLAKMSQEFVQTVGPEVVEEAQVDFFADARYPHQIWELEVPLRTNTFSSSTDLQQLCTDFHQVHEDTFAIQDPTSVVEVVSWRARVRCPLEEKGEERWATAGLGATENGWQETERTRGAYFDRHGWVEARVALFGQTGASAKGEAAKRQSRRNGLEGPAIIEFPFTTVVVPPGAYVERTSTGSLYIRLQARGGV